MKATAIILAGGKNTRIGRNKAAETIGGKTILERVIARVSPLVTEILIVTSAERTSFKGSGQATILTDAYPGQGPLGGIYTGLAAAGSEYSLVVASDMPFLNTKLLGYMLEQAAGFEAVVPRVDGGMIEPLHAVYALSCRKNIKERMDSNQLSVNQFVKTLRVRYIEPAESRRFDPDLLSFFNINYQTDLEKAIALDAASSARIIC